MGLAAFSTSLLACVIRWARCTKRHRSSEHAWIFALLAGVQFALLLDMAFDWRWKLHDYGMRTAMAHGLYGERRTPQLLVLLILVALLVVSLAVILYRFRHRVGVVLAMAGTLLSVGLWCSEALSYHFLDRVLYLMIGNAMLVSFLWGGFAVITCLGLWLDTLSMDAPSYPKR
jgi:hypothetical protein